MHLRIQFSEQERCSAAVTPGSDKSWKGGICSPSGSANLARAKAKRAPKFSQSHMRQVRMKDRIAPLRRNLPRAHSPARGMPARRALQVKQSPSQYEY